MSKKRKSKVEFASIESIKEDITAIENNDAAWTPEWLARALKSAWQEGQRAGNLDGYMGESKARNPFMTPTEMKGWYGA